MLALVVLLVRERKGYILACLTALYTTVIVNLAMQSRVLRFALPYPLIGEAPAAYGVIQYVVSALAAVIADSLLVSVLSFPYPMNQKIIHGIPGCFSPGDVI